MLKTITAHGTHATLEILRTTADIHALLGRAHPPKGEEFLRSQPGKSDDRLQRSPAPSATGSPAATASPRAGALFTDPADALSLHRGIR